MHTQAIAAQLVTLRAQLAAQSLELEKLKPLSNLIERRDLEIQAGQISDSQSGVSSYKSAAAHEALSKELAKSRASNEAFSIILHHSRQQSEMTLSDFQEIKSSLERAQEKLKTLNENLGFYQEEYQSASTAAASLGHELRASTLEVSRLNMALDLGMQQFRSIQRAKEKKLEEELGRMRGQCELLVAFKRRTEDVRMKARKWDERVAADAQDELERKEREEKMIAERWNGGFMDFRVGTGVETELERNSREEEMIKQRWAQNVPVTVRRRVVETDSDESESDEDETSEDEAAPILVKIIQPIDPGFEDVPETMTTQSSAEEQFFLCRWRGCRLHLATREVRPSIVILSLSYSPRRTQLLETHLIQHHVLTDTA